MLLRAKYFIWECTWGSKLLKFLLVLLLWVLSIWIWKFFSRKSIFLLFSLFRSICLLKWWKSLPFTWRLSTTLISLNLGRSLSMIWEVSWNWTQWRLWVFNFLWKIMRLICFTRADSCYFLLWRFLFSQLFLILFILVHSINSMWMSLTLRLHQLNLDFLRKWS